MSNNVNLHRCVFLLTSFQFFSVQIGFCNKIFLGNMALLIRSYHDILQFLAISCQDLTKISMRVDRVTMILASVACLRSLGHYEVTE